jgi:two-component system, cell cycle response regulator
MSGFSGVQRPRKTRKKTGFGQPAPASGQLRPAVALAIGNCPLRGELEEAVRELGFVPVVLPEDEAERLLPADCEASAVLVDLDWLEGEGVVRLRALRRDRGLARVPVVAAVARQDPRAAESALSRGADEVLPVPVSGAELSLRLRAAHRLGQLGHEVARLGGKYEMLLHIQRALTASLEPERILGTIVCQIAEMVAANRVSIVRVDDQGGGGRILVDFEDPRASDLRLDLQKYPEIRRALQTGEPQTIPDLAASPELAAISAQVGALAGTSVLAVPIDWEEAVLGPLVLRARRSDRPFTPEEIEACQMVVGLSVNAIRNARRFSYLQEEKERLEALSVTDQLTGAFNHAFLRMRLGDELELARSVGSRFAFLMLDIDDFKRVNDTYGHLIGDEVLREVTEEIRRVIRKADFLARYGGEEFGILLPHTAREGARRLAERIRRSMSRKRFSALPTDERLTVSIGVAVYPDPGISSAVDVIAHADSALYLAKARGKNGVCEHP